MRKLTLKDLLTFYTPCLSCKEKNSPIWTVNYLDPKIVSPRSAGPQYNLGEFPLSINGKHIEIDLKISYFGKFSLMVDVLSHAYISSDENQFQQYLANTNCYLRLKCVKCNSQIITNDLQFNSNKRLLKPVTIKGEQWHMSDEEYQYAVYTNMSSNESEIVVDKINATRPLSPWHHKIEAIPINKFSTKDNFLERIKTYMVFS